MQNNKARRSDSFCIICGMCSGQYAHQGRSLHGVGVCLSGSVTQEN
jgi:hypothetical protein